MWFAYFYYFVEHWPYAKFYCQFRQSSYYDEEVMDGQGKSFSFFSKFLKQNAHRFGFCPDFYWVFIIETTLNFAVRVANGTLSGTAGGCGTYLRTDFTRLSGQPEAHQQAR